jgi:hypothetical protein
VSWPAAAQQAPNAENKKNQQYSLLVSAGFKQQQQLDQLHDMLAWSDADSVCLFALLYSHCSMCLFLQTQNFQEWTTALVQDMHAQTAAANSSLAAIKGQLHSQQQVLQQSLQSLADLQTVQLQVADAAQAGLAEVKAVGALSIGIQQSMNDSLTMTVRRHCYNMMLVQLAAIKPKPECRHAAHFVV